MNDREILELALEGARANVEIAANELRFRNVDYKDSAIDKLRAAIVKYDKIKEQLKKESR